MLRAVPAATNALVRRCQEHKRRNGLDHLPEELHASAGRAMRDAWVTTKPLENLNGSIAHHARNLKRCCDGQMTLRWVASAPSDAKDHFRSCAAIGT
ncbi:MAG TPA: hypothetical protein VFZ93_10040 [Albitalea sp.]